MNIKIKQFAYKIQHKYLTYNNLTILVALIISFGFIWSSFGAIEKNYELEKQIGQKNKEMKLDQLQVDNLGLENKYYQTDEYKELAARKQLGLAKAGETILILPVNTTKASNIDKSLSTINSSQNEVKESNFAKWINFFSGETAKKAN